MESAGWASIIASAELNSAGRSFLTALGALKSADPIRTWQFQTQGIIRFAILFSIYPIAQVAVKNFAVRSGVFHVHSQLC